MRCIRVQFVSGLNALTRKWKLVLNPSPTQILQTAQPRQKEQRNHSTQFQCVCVWRGPKMLAAPPPLHPPEGIRPDGPVKGGGGAGEWTYVRRPYAPPPRCVNCHITQRSCCQIFLCYPAPKGKGSPPLPAPGGPNWGKSNTLKGPPQMENNQNMEGGEEYRRVALYVCVCVRTSVVSIACLGRQGDRGGGGVKVKAMYKHATTTACYHVTRTQTHKPNTRAR